MANLPSVEARRRSVGAELLGDGAVHFRVWAPIRRRVAVVVEGGPTVDLEPQTDGYFAGFAPASAGTRYRYRLDDDPALYPDPASRFQPDGPHGPSEVVDPTAFDWTDADWGGIGVRGQVIYEMHVGTFTPEGTWAAAVRQLSALKDVGVTVIEVMPVADFPGRFGWGYDGVNLFAPTRLYGRPDDFRTFVDRAHALGLGVILDVVYNHLGPDGNYLKQFADGYFSKGHTTEWGEAINYDGELSGPVREFFTANAAYWIDEFHLDGLRLDATQSIFDDSQRHVLVDVGDACRRAAGKRSVILVNENEPQHVKLIRPVAEGGYGLDMMWNDDFHHAAMVALTGRNEAYYTDYLGSPQEFISAAKYGYLYQGQWYRWQKKRRGSPTFGIPPAAFVTFIQNHDQVANSGRGLRAHALTSPGRYRAITALLLLAPGTPMLFQGQEFAASTPFYFFADHNPELAKLVCKGRAEFLAQFPSVAEPDMLACLPAPADPATFERCKLDPVERERNSLVVDLHRDLLTLRREEPAFRAQRPGGVDGAVLGPEAFVLRFFGDEPGGPDDRLLVVNLGRDLHLNPAPEPLLSPPEGRRWQTQWSSEDPKYGAGGTPPVDTADDNWHVPGQAAVVLRPVAGSPGGA
jgi:maltooligosyltrehalose trehalohydrolase